MLTRFSRGDTIIEVIFAITIFSLLAVGGLSVMNKGVAISQKSLEISLTRQNIDTQAEVLRFIHDAYVASKSSDSTNNVAAVWKDITNTSASKPRYYESSSVPKISSLITNCAPPTGRAFVINPKSLKIVDSSNFASAQTYPQIVYSGSGSTIAAQGVEGLWVQQVRSAASGGSPGYSDFHIRACWRAGADNVPVVMGTIVRLYEPI